MVEDSFETTKDMECDSHGAYISAFFKIKNGEYWTSCPSCLEIKKEQDQIELRKREALQRKQMYVWHKLKQRAIPDTFEKCNFDNYRLESGKDQAEVFAACKHFSTNFSRAKKNNIHGLFVGNTGTGKTHLAVAMLKEISQQGYSALFTTLSEMSLSVRSTFGKDKSANEAAMLNTYYGIDFLIIDECAVKFKSSDYELRLLFEIVNKRYQNGNPTLILSNSMQDIESKIGSRVLSRIYEGEFIHTFTWEDYRLKKAS